MFADVSFAVFLIPVVAGAVGWFTNWVAVRMVLYPVQFKGFGPIGWQGVIPANVEGLGANFSRLIDEELLNLPELLKDVGDDDEEVNRIVARLHEKTLKEFSEEIAPEQWAKAREKLREYISQLIEKNSRSVVRDILDELKVKAPEFIDIEKIVMDAMRAEPGLLGHVMTEVAGPEFKFIERSGWWFGLLFGLGQMTVWLLFPEQWILPLCGFLVGYVTNYLAMHLIFEPRTPVKVGPFVIQGVFIKRQLEVARAFSDVISDRVLTEDNLKSHIREGDSRQRITNIVEGYVERSLTDYEKDPMVLMLVDKGKLAETKEDVLARVRDADFDDDSSDMGEDTSRMMKKQSTHMREQMHVNLEKLDSERFGGILRPIFQEDEWKLMLAGGMLGTGAGALQAIFFFGGLF
jgi:uncharacterized membrane protein YheB (UPF0754 family)